MKVLVTGAGGQLGRDCLQILEKKHTVHGFSSRQLDITKKQQLEQLITSLQPDVVVNCAAYTAVDACETHQEKCREVNTKGAANLAWICKKTHCRLIHISTDYVFDGNKTIPEAYTEEDIVSPLSAYGRTKLAGEQSISSSMDDYLILRTAWLYGMGGGNFLKTMLRLAVSDPKRTIKVVNDQYGSLTWTRTLARQIEQLLTPEVQGIAHATAEQHCTWFEGARYFLQAMGVDFSLEPCTTAEYPTPAHRPANSILANNRLKENGIHIMQSWKQDIDDFTATYRDDLLTEAKI